MMRRHVEVRTTAADSRVCARSRVLAAVVGAIGALLLVSVPVRPAHADEHGPYINWTAGPIASKPGAPAGYLVFERSCAVCHGSGPGKPGTRALAAKYKGKLPALLEQRTDLTPEYIRQVVRHGLFVMPFFRKTELSDADLNAIVVYLAHKQR